MAKEKKSATGQNAKGVPHDEVTTPGPDTHEGAESAAPSSETKKQTSGVVTRQAGPAKGGKKRIGFPLTDSGVIDWPAMHDKTREELRVILKSDPQVVTLHKGSVELADRFDEKTAGAILDGFAAVERVVFGKLFHLNAQVAARVFVFGPPAHQELDPALVAVAVKYGDKLPDWLVKYKEEFVLAMALGKITFAQCMAALAIQKAANQQAQAAADRAESERPQTQVEVM